MFHKTSKVKMINTLSAHKYYIHSGEYLCSLVDDIKSEENDRIRVHNVEN